MNKTVSMKVFYKENMKKLEVNLTKTT